jgi:hypothetical protein
MGSTGKTTWIAGTVLLGIAIAALSWFVFIAPVVADTGTAATDTQVAEDRNRALTDHLDDLASDFAKLDEYKAELQTIEAQIPGTASSSEFLRTIDTLAAAAPTAIINVELGTPVYVVPPVAEAAPAAAAAEETTTDSSEETTTDGTETATDGVDAAAAPAVPAVIPGFVAVPVSVTALGNPLGVLQFLGALQEQSGRLMLVTGMTGTGQDEAEASGGRPATAQGDLELEITGYIYVLQDVTAALGEVPDEPAAVAPPVGDGAGAFAGA